MPNLKTVLDSAEALQQSIDRMSQPGAVREQVRLNHGIRSFDELAALVSLEPFEDDNLDAVYEGARHMTSRNAR